MALWTDPRIPELGPNVQRAHGRLAAAMGRFMMGIRGWRVEGGIPDIPKMVLIVAPHTSNWDFLTGLWVKLGMRMGAPLRRQAHALPRAARRLHALARRGAGGPLGRRRVRGGDRARGARVRADDAGPRSRGHAQAHDAWKSGFYRIATAAGVPILLAGFDYPRKVIFFGPLVEPTGDYEKDLAEIQSHYGAGMALKPENYGTDHSRGQSYHPSE
jgi:hypothetical protein